MGTEPLAGGRDDPARSRCPAPQLLEYARRGPHDERFGCAGSLAGSLFVFALGLLLVYGVVATLADRWWVGYTMLQPWGIAILGPVGLLFTWAGGLGIRYWYLRRKLQPLQPTSSRLTHAVRRLFHADRYR